MPLNVQTLAMLHEFYEDDLGRYTRPITCRLRQPGPAGLWFRHVYITTLLRAAHAVDCSEAGFLHADAAILASIRAAVATGVGLSLCKCYKMGIGDLLNLRFPYPD